MRGNHLDDFKDAAAIGAAPAADFVAGRWRWWLRRKQRPALRRALAPATVGHPTVLSDAHKALGEDMQQEPADKLLGGECHVALLAAVCAVLPTKRNLPILHAEEPMIEDGHNARDTAMWPIYPTA